jgi:hypothetical protein
MPARPGSGAGVSLGPASLSESFLRKKLDENLQELDRLRLNLRSVLAEPLAGAPDPRHVRFEEAALSGRRVHGFDGAGAGAVHMPRNGEEHTEEESFSLSPASASPTDSPMRGHGRQKRASTEGGEEYGPDARPHGRFDSSHARPQGHTEHPHEDSGWPNRTHAGLAPADEPPWRTNPHYTGASAAPAAARPAAGTSGLYAGGSQGTSSNDDEIHRRAQELLRARPVFRPDIFSLVSVMVVCAPGNGSISGTKLLT